MKSAVLVKPALHYPLIWNQLHTLFYKERFFQIILNAALLLLDDNVDEENKKFSNSKNSASGCCLAFAWFFAYFNLMLLIKVLLIKKCLVVPALLSETCRLQHSSITRFFYKQNFFSTQPRCRLSISWIELQMLLGYCLIHITIIIRGGSRAAATSKMECFMIIVNGIQPLTIIKKKHSILDVAAALDPPLIIFRLMLCLVYLCPCLDVGQSISYEHDPFGYLWSLK